MVDRSWSSTSSWCLDGDGLLLIKTLILRLRRWSIDDKDRNLCSFRNRILKPKKEEDADNGDNGNRGKQPAFVIWQ